MGLQINKELNRADGLTIPSSSVLTWSTTFLAGSRNIIFNPLLVFLSIQDRDDYYNGVVGAPQPSTTAAINDMSGAYEKEMTVEEQAALSDAGAFELVEGWLKDLIVANSNEYLTDGDIVIIPSVTLV
jgi:hypothetical protein